MALVVQKYGGSSVASPAHIKRVAAQILQEQKHGNQVVVVVSAMGDTTDHLVSMSREISKNPPEREMDMLLSVGERISIAMLAMAIHEMGGNAISFTGSQVGIITDTRHTEARILEVRANRILDELNKGRIVIVAGFQGVSIDKEITTLGRGGSDTTAIALAAALKAERCEIMKDVDGIFISEPKLVPDVRLNEEISYDEMIEMANMGAGVLKTESVEIARLHGIKVGVGSSFTGKIGTIITDKTLDITRITGIVGLKNLTGVTGMNLPPSFLIDFTTTLFQSPVKTYGFFASRNFLNMIIKAEHLPAVQKIMEAQGNGKKHIEWEVKNNLGLVTIIGSNINLNPEIPENGLKCLEKMKSVPWQIEISRLHAYFLLAESAVDQAIKLLYNQFQKQGLIGRN